MALARETRAAGKSVTGQTLFAVRSGLLTVCPLLYVELREIPMEKTVSL